MRNLTLHRCCFRFSPRLKDYRFQELFHLSGAFPCIFWVTQSPQTLIFASSTRLWCTWVGFSSPELGSWKCLQVAGWSLGSPHLFPSLRIHSCAVPGVIKLKNNFSYVLSSFLIVFSGRASILVTLSTDFSFLFIVAAVYSLKKQVCLASKGYHGLDFANYNPLVQWTCFSDSLYFLGIGNQIQNQFCLARVLNRRCHVLLSGSI